MKENGKKLALATLPLAGFSVFLTVLLEFFNQGLSVGRIFAFIGGHPLAFIFNAAVYFALLLLFRAITKRAIIGCGLFCIVTIILGFITSTKFVSREAPLLPDDLTLIGNVNSLTNFVSTGAIIKLVLAIVFVIAISIFAEVKFDKRAAERVSIRIVSGAFSLVLFFGLYFSAGAVAKSYDYRENGFLLGFIHNLQNLKPKEPSNYNQDSVIAIRNEYTERAEKENKKRQAPDDVNVVIVLGESYFNPSVSFEGANFTDVYPLNNAEVTPNINALMKKNPSGYMYSIDYGGGTANVEYEVFEGLSNYWLNITPYNSLVPKVDSVPSIARDLKDSYRYDTVAIHPFNADMYSRNIALVREGFDEFIDVSKMTNTNKEPGSDYINDASAYRETLKVLSEHDEATVIGLITMQNHLPFLTESYEHYDFEVTDDSLSTQDKANLRAYFQSMHQADKYLGEFIDELEKFDEKTVVVFFGDHAPGIFPKLKEHSDERYQTIAQLTPYFFYANYDVFEKAESLPINSPNCIMNSALNSLGWKKSALYYLLDDVCGDAPILANYYVDEAELADIESIKKYELLNYDILIGDRYWYK